MIVSAWALLGLTGPYWALLNLTGPYWALLGLLLDLTGPFTGPYCAFYWALLRLLLGLTQPTIF